LIPQPQATTPLIHFPIQTIADYLCIELLACLLTKIQPVNYANT